MCSGTQRTKAAFTCRPNERAERALRARRLGFPVMGNGFLEALMFLNHERDAALTSLKVNGSHGSRPLRAPRNATASRG
jgi:hypothetical protein